MDKNTVKKNKSQIIIAAVIIIAVLIVAAAVGFIVPKSGGVIERSLVSLRKSDKEYKEASDTESKLDAENKRLRERKTSKKEELEEFKQSQDNLDKITESNSALEKEKEELEAEISRKKERLESLEASSQGDKTVTWSSGDYTVGKDIAAGKYTVSGSGSIAIANNGKARTNKALSTDGEAFTLRDGDKVHIDGSAKLTPQRGGRYE